MFDVFDGLDVFDVFDGFSRGYVVEGGWVEML